MTSPTSDCPISHSSIAEEVVPELPNDSMPEDDESMHSGGLASMRISDGSYYPSQFSLISLSGWFNISFYFSIDPSLYIVAIYVYPSLYIIAIYVYPSVAIYVYPSLYIIAIYVYPSLYIVATFL